MSRKIKILLASFLFLLPLSVLAIETHNGDNVLLGADTVIDSNYYAAGQTIEIYGTVNGDLFLAGKNITIDSENINGDIFAAGESITIKGKINGSVRFAGQHMSVSGYVRDNVLSFGQNLKLDPESILDGHLTFWGQALSLRGQVNGQVEGGMDSLSLSGTVGKNVDVYLENTKEGNVNIEDQAFINGALHYRAWKELAINPNAVIKGGPLFEKLEDKKAKPWTSKATSLLIKFFGLLVVGMVFLYLWPKMFGKAYDKAYKNTVPTFLKGLLFLIVVPIICIILLITVIGIPMAGLLFVTWLMLLYLAKVVAAWLTGQFIKSKFFEKKKIAKINILAIGVFVYMLLGQIPFIGTIFAVIIFLLALGTFVSYFIKSKK
ncbi:hypothetical protein HON36_00110 [Candidatus Parcubacteria bacterium]|jgi:cytoskeletal protein CcmA (bactofilin family)|nr:hypothetical protein [Candidatus Parcubacteria bacterium]MBT7228304.1 hypothetical protein [Candidatus Parcubacteria bacterium]